MKFAFRHWILIFSILLLIPGCKSAKEDDSLNKFMFTSIEDFERLLLENDGTVDEESPGYVHGRYKDKYGNTFMIYQILAGGFFLECVLNNIPDTVLLLHIKNYIIELIIEFNNPLTDISFLKDLQQLKTLVIRETGNILSFEPLGKLSSLERLSIYNYDLIIDCSIFANLKSLKSLALTEKVINLETIFDKTQEEFKLPDLNYISIGEYTMNKRKDGYFLGNVKGLTPSDGSTRTQYGNSKGEIYIDQYGNRFNGVWDYDAKHDKISVDILHAPDIDVLSRLANNIISLDIKDTSPITDISFLENSTQLETLWVRNATIKTFEPLKNSFKLQHFKLRNPSITAIESLRYLNHLSSLVISLSLDMDLLTDNGYDNVSDFLYSIRDIENIKELNLPDSELEDTDETYLLAQEMLKISNLEQISLGENHFYKNARKSYEFETETYHILQYRANVRAWPGRSSTTIAVLSLHDEVEIVENTFVEEKINDVWGFWYKIKFGNLLGYTFGGNIAYKALATDIDKNGIKDYFYWRYSTDGHRTFINPNTDVIIYINGIRLGASVLSTTERYYDGHYFEWCRFEEGDDDVLIGLSQYGRHDYEYMHIFKVTPDGGIEYVQNWNEIDYW
jgi:hypothetical protein